MQDSSASQIAHGIDILTSNVYCGLVTKDTTLEERAPERMDAAESLNPASDVSPTSRSEGTYYAVRHARFMEAIKGRLPISEYVKEVAAEVDRRFPPIPQE
jgi:hypothetical protein